MARKSTRETTESSVSAPELCPQCREFVGRNYPGCPACRQVAEQPMKVAWQALLNEKGVDPATPEEPALAVAVLEQSDQYWWSEVEAALRLTSYPACGGPLGYGSPDCAECIWSSDMHWGRDVEVDANGTILRNEHALRVLLRGLAQSHRHSQASIEGWRLYLPFVLRGSNPAGTRDDVRHAHAINAWIKAGRGKELATCRSVEEMYAITQRGRK